MKAIIIDKSRSAIDAVSFANTVIWQVPEPVLGSAHHFKYSLSYIVRGDCVLRYDNERGKGDHRHWLDEETAYNFTSLEQLLRDFYSDISTWRASK
jgi:hypothetical protein